MGNFLFPNFCFDEKKYLRLQRTIIKEKSMGASDFRNRLLGMQDNLLSFALKLTANREDAHDLLQDTTCKALVNEDKFVEDTNFKSWVFTIMRNIFINNYRRIARTQTAVDRSDDLYQLNLPQIENSETPESAYALKEVTVAVKGLSDDYRVPLVMHISGYKYQEIADALQIPLGTVKSRIFFAKKRLQDELQDFR